MARVCAVPRCPELAVDKRHCEKHQQKPKPKPQYKHRLSAHRRGYGHKWRQERELYLREHPWCVMCARLGKDVRATQVDNTKPHSGDQALFWDRENNWRALWARHHALKTGGGGRGWGEGVAIVNDSG